jgi:3-oxoacyl-[acyl-carrier protein] reductase
VERQRYAAAAVTGAAQGIGRAVAEELAARGVGRVWMLDIGAEELERTVTALKGCGAEIIGVPLDVTDPAARDDLRRRWRADGVPDLLVNSAGIRPDPIGAGAGRADVAQFERTLAVNLTGTFAMLDLVVREWIADDVRGTVVNLASVAAHHGFGGRVAYCASKGGVAALTQAAALDLAEHGIRVLAVAPGLVRTPMTRPEDDAFVADVVPLGRRADVEEVAGFLVDAAEAPYISGSTLTIDGALTAGYRM